MAKKRPLFKIGSFTPAPVSSYVGTESTVVDSGRNTKGYVVGAVVRNSVAKIDVKWNYITVKDWSDILKKFNPNYGGKFYQQCEFFNQVSGGFEKRTFYVSDRTSSGLIVLDENGNPRGWQDASLSLVEK